MRGYRRERAKDYEGLVLVEEVNEDGSTDSYWDTPEAVAERQKPNCGKCCHPRGSILVIGKCENGMVNGKPLKKYVSGLAKERKR